MSQTTIAEGAEAKIFLITKGDKTFVRKQRITKKYRIKEIDSVLRKSRTRREAKVMTKLPINAPTLFNVDEKEMIIDMEFIDGEKIRNYANKDNCVLLGKEIGHMIALMHNVDIMHGDLTTSNMIFYDNKIYFIDFGLSFFSSRIEDRAVDLHLIKEALQSTHHEYFETFFNAVLLGYKEHAQRTQETLKQFENVELRGRYKHKN